MHHTPILAFISGRGFSLVHINENIEIHVRDTLPSLLQAATATILLSLLIENTAIWLMNNPIVIPTETCIILSPNENEPRYADSAVVFDEYAERSPPSRPNADCTPQFSRQSAPVKERTCG